MVKVTSKELNNIHSKFVENVPIITIAEIKEIVNENNNCSIRINKIEKLKEKLTKISDEGCWDLDEIFLEDNYSDTTVFDCIVNTSWVNMI